MGRTRKPPVKPEVRRAWLRRNEEDGESPPQIAAADGFDVRTVRKQIELARQEREVREARSMVLRNAMESHYRDLCKFAEKLDLEVSGDKTISPLLKDDPMWSALREHMPRSPLWNKLDRWGYILDEIAKMRDNFREQLGEKARLDSRMSEIIATDENGVIPGIVAALDFQIKNWAQGSSGLNINEYFKVEPAGEGFVKISYGAFNMGKVKEEHATPIREVLIYLESEITGWEQHHKMQGLFSELQRLKLGLRDELTVIKFRRIVPGRCKYCPM